MPFFLIALNKFIHKLINNFTARMVNYITNKQGVDIVIVSMFYWSKS